MTDRSVSNNDNSLSYLLFSSRTFNLNGKIIKTCHVGGSNRYCRSASSIINSVIRLHSCHWNVLLLCHFDLKTSVSLHDRKCEPHASSLRDDSFTVPRLSRALQGSWGLQRWTAEDATKSCLVVRFTPMRGRQCKHLRMEAILLLSGLWRWTTYYAYYTNRARNISDRS